MTWLALAAALWYISTPTAEWSWSPASGPVSGYSVRDALSGVEIATVAEPSVVIPIADRTASSQISIVVVAFDAEGNLGPPSIPSEPVTGVPIGYNADWDGDGELLPNDFTEGAFRLYEMGGQFWRGR